MEQMTEKTEKGRKKDYLRKYGGHVRRIKMIESELAELHAMRASVSVNREEISHKLRQSSFSGYAGELEQMEYELIQEKYERLKAYKNITDYVKRLSCENEKEVLFYRYIKGLEWCEIAKEMGYSERQIHRYHDKALVHFEIPEEKDVTECQTIL